MKWIWIKTRLIKETGGITDRVGSWFLSLDLEENLDNGEVWLVEAMVWSCGGVNLEKKRILPAKFESQVNPVCVSTLRRGM